MREKADAEKYRVGWASAYNRLWEIKIEGKSEAIMISQNAISIERPDGVKNTRVAPLWEELSSLNHFIWASSASVGGLTEAELPQVRNGIRSDAPQSGLPSPLTTHQFMHGKSFFSLSLLFICSCTRCFDVGEHERRENTELLPLMSENR